MKKVTTILLLVFALSKVTAQKKEIDFQLYEKIQSGQYPSQAYLKGLIQKKYIEKDFEFFFSQNDFKGLLALGLINSILAKDYNGKYQMSQYFEYLKYYEYQKTTYFYQSCSIRGEKELFIWGTYDSQADSFKLESRIVSETELTSYEFEIKMLNGQEYILFKADELVVVGAPENANWTTIKYKVSGKKDFIGTYRDCSVLNGTDIKCKRSQWKGNSGEVPIEKRVFTSPLNLDDLDNDGKPEFYWFAVSNGSLVHLECFEVINKNLKLKDEGTHIENLKTKANFKMYIDISKMKVNPKK